MKKIIITIEEYDTITKIKVSDDENLKSNSKKELFMETLLISAINDTITKLKKDYDEERNNKNE